MRADSDHVGKVLLYLTADSDHVGEVLLYLRADSDCVDRSYCTSELIVTM